MSKTKKSAIVVGFNVRPLAYSLHKAGLEVYAIDFFGDLDLYPFVKDSIIVTDELNDEYENLKDNYKHYLAKFCIDLMERYSNIDYLLIGSGLDDAFDERKMILEYILKKDSGIISLNNNLETIKRARDIEQIYSYLKSHGFSVPHTVPLKKTEVYDHLQFPLILKKKSSSGGTNVYRIDDISALGIKIQQIRESDILNEWLLQEFIEGIPVSCTIISNGMEREVISINRQIIGLNLVNPPKEFMYCGNVVPAYLTQADRKKILEISYSLTDTLKLKGINGFDFVLKNHIPYLMEINPRIPGSIRASEESLGINLLDLHIQCFSSWEKVKNILKYKEMKIFATKLIVFAPNTIPISKIKIINKMKYVHDKSPPIEPIQKYHPICTILYKDKNFADSFFNTLKIADDIFQLVR